MTVLPPSPFLNSVSPGALSSSLPSGESDPSVTTDWAPGESRFDGPDIPLAELTRRGFDVWKFMDALPPPLHADELIPVLQVLAGDSFMADIEPIRAAIARH